MFEVYDDRTNEVVFSSKEKDKCIEFLLEVDTSDDYENHEFYWIREV